MSLMNGLAALGAGVSQFAGAAGLEAQRSSLEMDKIKLADELAAGRQVKQNEYASAEAVLDRASRKEMSAATNVTSETTARISAGAMLGATQMQIDANRDLRIAQTAEITVKNDLSTTQLVQVKAVTALQQQLADAYASPTPDQDLIKKLGDQITAQGMDAKTRAGILTSLDSLARTEQANVALLTRHLTEETDKLGDITLDPVAAARQQRVIDALQTDLKTARARQSALIDQARSVMPGGPAPASQPAAGLINSGDRAAAVAPPANTQIAAVTVPTAPAGMPTSAVGGDTPKPIEGVKLPGEMGNETSLDKLKALRPDLNFDLLKDRNPMVINRVIQLIEGRESMAPLGTRSKTGADISMLAASVDPTLDRTSSENRVKTRILFTSGIEARNISALNTALGHAGEVADRFKTLNNSTFPAFNWALNNVESGVFGDARKGNAELAVDALASEARKVFAGGSAGGGLTELENWQKNFPVNGSPRQQQEALSTFVNLLNSRLDALGDQYNRGMGVTRDPVLFLEPKARKVIETLTGVPVVDTVGRQLGKSFQTPSGPAPRPAGVPSWVAPGDSYSPSRGQARRPDGSLYEAP